MALAHPAPFVRFLAAPSTHFPALFTAVQTWNARNAAVQTIVARLPPDFPDTERLGLLYRFSGTMLKHSRRLRALGLDTAPCADALRAYDAAIAATSRNVTEQSVANPEQVVFDHAKRMLADALQAKEELAMQGRPGNQDLKALFVKTRELFALLGEWCDREDEATMVVRCCPPPL